MVEIIFVVIIIAILATMVGPNIVKSGKKARVKAAVTDIESNISSSLDLYEIENGRYPTTEQGLRALLEKPSAAPVSENWNGPYFKKKKLPVDPWGKDYVYVCPGSHNTDSYDLSSVGADGVESADDVINWTQGEKE